MEPPFSEDRGIPKKTSYVVVTHLLLFLLQFLIEYIKFNILYIQLGAFKIVKAYSNRGISH